MKKNCQIDFKDVLVNIHNSINFCVQFWSCVGLIDFTANLCKVKYKLYTLNYVS